MEAFFQNIDNLAKLEIEEEEWMKKYFKEWFIQSSLDFIFEIYVSSNFSKIVIYLFP